MVEPVAVETYRFNPDDLAPDKRLPGISAFVRVKNGADFIEATIRSHMPYFDEIVVVMNQCSDATPDIVARLAAEFGPQRLPTYRYLPEVYPPGSEGHMREPADSPRSLVNYYNFALTRTRFRVATKLDDDHLAIEPALAALTGRVRSGADPADVMVCFGGINLARAPEGGLGIPADEPFSGSGDIGFFPVAGDTYFVHDKRFERFRRGALRRVFGGIVYWHLKYLKPEFGFANYDLPRNPSSRYARRLKRLTSSNRPLLTPHELVARTPSVAQLLPWLRLPGKMGLIHDRWLALRELPELQLPRALVAAPNEEARR